MRITIAICTWNRAKLLQQTLAQMTRMAVPKDVDWELLVVNNNSTDNTDEIVTSFADRLPLRGLFEPTPGKSHALNRATREAIGQYIVWTDDDALVDERWLASYSRAFRQWPTATFFGGPVEPWFEGTPPTWVDSAWTAVPSAYAVRDLGPEPIPFTTKLVPYGVNMAVRTEEQVRFLYDPKLGPRPGSEVRGEETAMIQAMLAAGLQGWWVPDARVRHFIPAQRQSIRYLRDFYEGEGAHEVVIGEVTPSRGSWAPRWVLRQAVESELKYRLHRLLSPPNVWVKHLVQASRAWGILKSIRSIT